MSYLIATPELVAAAAGNLTGIQLALGDAAAAASGPTTGLLAAAADEVSAAITQLFGNYGRSSKPSTRTRRRFTPTSWAS